MPAPKLPQKVSLQAVREELVFSMARVSAEPKAVDVAPMLAALLASWAGVNEQQLVRWDAQIAADALVSAADDRLDTLVERLSGALLAVVRQKRADPRYRLYFQVTPTELKRPVLGPQLETLRGWLTHLAVETEPVVKAVAAEFPLAVKQAGDAVKARRKADADNEQFRAKGGLATYLREVDKTRDAVYAKLDGRPAKDDTLPRGFAALFFRHRKPAAPKASEKDARAAARAAEKAAAEATKQAVTDAKAKVREAQKALKALGGK